VCKPRQRSPADRTPWVFVLSYASDLPRLLLAMCSRRKSRSTGSPTERVVVVGSEDAFNGLPMSGASNQKTLRAVIRSRRTARAALYSLARQACELWTRVTAILVNWVRCPGSDSSRARLFCRRSAPSDRINDLISAIATAFPASTRSVESLAITVPTRVRLIMTWVRAVGGLLEAPAAGGIDPRCGTAAGRCPGLEREGRAQRFVLAAQ